MQPAGARLYYDPMPIVGHGIDIVSVVRIEESVVKHGERFLERCFTEGERAYADDRKRRFEHLAGRFAAKEAVLKAFGTGWRTGIAWTDVEVVLEPSGRPRIELHNRAAEIAKELGIETVHISISHTDELATASAIAES